MRVLIIPSRYLPHHGGLETTVREVSQQLVRSGHIVAIVTNRYPRRLPRHETIDNVPVTRLQFLYPQFAYLKAGRLDLWLGGLVYFPLTLLRLALILRAYKPDVVNLHYLGSPSLFVWILHLLFRFPLVVSLQGGDVDAEPYRSRFNRWLFRAVLARADAVTACSRALLDQALQLVPDIASKACVIHNGVDAELFATAEPYSHPKPYILAVGQLLRHKGFDDLITAYAQAQPFLAHLDVLIAGDGPERQSLQAQVVANKLNDQVHFLGAVTREQVASLMRGAAVIVIPSRREPFGIVALEAMASGRPVVATPVGGLVEALEGAKVSWIEPGDPKSLQLALCQLARQAIADNPVNQAIAAKRDWKVQGDSFIHLFVRVAQRNSAI